MYRLSWHYLVDFTRGMRKAMSALRPWRSTLVVLIIAFAAAQQDAEIFEEPEVEPSELERHQSGRSTMSGGPTQYDFVSEEAARIDESGEEETGGDGSPGDILRRLFGGSGGGQSVQMINLEGDGAPELSREMKDMIDSLKKMHEQLLKTRGSRGSGGGSSKGRSRNERSKGPSLPSIPPGTPISEVLQHIRQSLARETAERKQQQQQEEEDAGAAQSSGGADALHPRRIGSDVVRSAHDANDFVDRLDARGLDLLEAELQSRLRRVWARRRELALGGERGLEEGDSAAADVGVKPGNTGGWRRSTSTPIEPAASSLEQALQRMLRRIQPGGAAAAAASADDDDEGDETQRYAERLAAEGRAKDRRSGGDDDEDDEEEGGELSRPRSLGELLGLTAGDGGEGGSEGGGEGGGVQLKILMAPNGDAVEGAEIELSGVGSLLEMLENAIKGGDAASGSSSVEEEEES